MAKDIKAASGLQNAGSYPDHQSEQTDVVQAGHNWHPQVEQIAIGDLKDYHRQLRVSSSTQEKKTIRMIEEHGGFYPPPIVDENNTVVIGQFIVNTLRKMGVIKVNVIRISHLTETQIRTLRISYDRIAEEAKWDRKQLLEEFLELQVDIPDLTITGFELEEINQILDLQPDGGDDAPIPTIEEGPAVTQSGDVWILGNHRLYCGDATLLESYKRLMGVEKAQMGFTDIPYNVTISGHVGNSGKTKHREFLQGSGEMSTAAFSEFTNTSHMLMAQHCDDGAIIFSCMDWRHIKEMIDAAAAAALSIINLCVWVKDNGGMGSLYRSRHELVFVCKKGKAKHVNNVELGKNGRYRTNVWEYPGVNSFGGNRMDELKLHPTVKPTEMVIDAIKDCSMRGDIILDPFGGSGTTLIAAEKTDRKARLIELDPLYCDVIIRRWQQLTGLDAVHAETGKTFNEILTHGDNDYE